MVAVRHHVEDIDTTHARCVANGAAALMPVGDKFRGERMAKMHDPFSREWSLTAVTEAQWADEIAQRAKTAASRRGSSGAGGCAGGPESGCGRDIRIPARPRDPRMPLR